MSPLDADPTLSSVHVTPEVRRAYDALPQIAWLSDARGRTVYVNARWTAYTGQDEAASLGLGFLEAIHPDDREKVERAWTRSLAAGDAYDVEYRLRRADGAYRWHRSQARRLPDAGGWAGLCIDVHVQRAGAPRSAGGARALARTAALQRLGARLGQAEDEAGVLRALHDEGFAAVGATGAFLGLPDEGDPPGLREAASLGLRPETVRAWRRFPLAAETPVAAAARDGAPLYFPTRAALAARFPASAENARANDAEAVAALPVLVDGRFGGLALPFPTEQDFTAEDRAFLETLAAQLGFALTRTALQTRLRAREARHRTLLRAITQQVWGSDAEGRGLHDEWWEALTGQGADEARADGGWGWLSRLHPDDRERMRTEWTRSLRTREVFDLRYRVLNRDGEERVVRARGVPHEVAGDPGEAEIEWIGTFDDVTDAVRAEEARRESARRLELALSAARLGLWESVLPQGDLHWTGEMERLYGFAPGEFRGELAQFLDRVHPDDRARLLDASEAAARAGRPIEDEFRIVLPDGTQRWIRTVGRALYDEGGRPARMLGVNLDVTERRRAEEALRDSERRLSLALEAGKMGVWTYDVASGRQEWSPTQHTLFGLREGEFEGTFDHFVALVHPDDRNYVLGMAGRMTEGGTDFSYGFRVQRPDGEVRWLRGVGRVERDAAGRAVHMIGVNHDVTEERRDEEALRASEARFRLLAENASDLVSLVTPEGVIEYASPSHERLLGFRPDEMVGVNVYDLLPPDQHAPVGASHEAVLADRPFAVTYRGRRKDGTRLWLESTSRAIRDADGNIAQLQVTTRDVTERVEAHLELERRVAERTEELHRSVEELRRSNLELERFAYVASHDLQGPLRTVSSFTEVIARRLGDNLDGTTGRYMTLVQEGVGRMKALIDGLLSYSRLGTRELASAPVDTAELVRTVLADLHADIGAAGATVEPGGLPTVRGDAGQLRGLFANLVQNAVKFRRAGVPPRVEVRAAPEGTFWHFTVEDNGIGIDPEHFERIFGIFERLHSREAFEGSGIGLALCRRTVERHGGRLWVESTPGAGSAFHFTLPGAGGPDAT